MSYVSSRTTGAGFWGALAALLLAVLVTVRPASVAAAEVTAFKQAVAEAAAADPALSAFYRSRDYKPLWTSGSDSTRRGAFFRALEGAGEHGLPEGRYDPGRLEAAFRAVATERDRGRLEVEMSKAFLDYAADLQTGVLTPKKVDPGIVREVPLRDRLGNLVAFSKSSPAAFLRSLPPKAPEYAQLMKAKITLEKAVGQGGWGPKVQSKRLDPGATGGGVVQLRNRLIAMGYMKRSASQSYDGALQKAVQQFQLDNGVSPDGVAGEGTLALVNLEPVDRLQSVIVAMERLRWMNGIEMGKRHIWVNLTDFTAKIIDNDKVTFETRSVVGMNQADRRSPEFSDQMEFMVINPTWNVPRSITVKEYLPMLQRNPNAAGHLKIIDARGRVVPRDAVDFTQFTARNFPFAMKQPPSDGNALGLVKFMFPNPYNIYLHDTPSKSLFAKEVRAYSHGCIRLGDPFDFAYALLAPQTNDPEGEFKRHLATGAESVLPLAKPVPVHLVYFTAWPSAKGRIEYRRDVYGRDARIFAALLDAGVVLRGVQG